MSYAVSILIEAVDRASGVLSGVAGALGEFGGVAGAVAGVVSGVLTKAIDLLVEALERAIEVARECVDAYAQYEWVLIRVATATGAVGEQAHVLAGQFEELTRRVGVEFGVGATRAAEALESLVKAGLEGEEATEALEATLMLAQIELMDTGEAADYVAAILRAFSLSADQAAHVVDVLVNASIKGIATARDFAYALSYCSGIAAQLGLSLEETVAALVAMNNQGIQATYAGRYLMRMLQDLIEHSDKLGFSIYDASGRLLSLSEIIARLEAKLAEFSTDEERAAYLTEIFGTQGMRAALALINASYAGEKGAEALQALTEALGEAGTASAIFEEQMGTLAGTLARARARIQDAMLAIGEALAPLIEVASEAFSKLVRVIAKALAPFIAKLSKLLAKLLHLFERIGSYMLEALEPIGEALYEMFEAMVDVLIELIDAIAENEELCRALGYALAALIICLNPLLTILALVAQAFKLVKEHGDEVARAFERLASVFSLVGQVVSDVFAWIGARAQELFSAVMGVFQGIWSFLTSIFTPAIQALQAVFQTAWMLMQRAVAAFWAIAQPILTALHILIEAVRGAISWLQEAWQTAWTTMQDVVQAVWAIVGPVFEAIRAAIQAIIDALTSLWNALCSVGEQISGFFDWLGDQISGFVDWLVGGSIWPDMLAEMAELLDRYLGIMEERFHEALRRMREDAEDFKEETVGRSIWPETLELMYTQAEHYLGRVESLFEAWREKAVLTLPTMGIVRPHGALGMVSVEVHIYVERLVAQRPEELEALAREIGHRIARELRLRGVIMA